MARDESLGKAIFRLRKGKGWTQEVLEEQSGVPQSTISALENERQKETSFEYIRRLATALDVSRNVLLRAMGVADEEEPPQLAPVQLPLSDPDEAFDADEIVEYVESRPGARFREQMGTLRDSMTYPDYVQLCIGIFRAWASNSNLALTTARLIEQRGQ